MVIETTMEKSLLKRNIYRYTTFLGLSLCHSQDAQNVEFIIIPLVACKCILGPIQEKACRFTQRIDYPSGRFRIFGFGVALIVLWVILVIET